MTLYDTIRPRPKDLLLTEIFGARYNRRRRISHSYALKVLHLKLVSKNSTRNACLVKRD